MGQVGNHIVGAFSTMAFVLSGPIGETQTVGYYIDELDFDFRACLHPQLVRERRNRQEDGQVCRRGASAHGPVFGLVDNYQCQDKRAQGEQLQSEYLLDRLQRHIDRHFV
jgi:hypothetical protein